MGKNVPSGLCSPISHSSNGLPRLGAGGLADESRGADDVTGAAARITEGRTDTMGLSPDRRTSMKILWEFVHAKQPPVTLSVRGRKLGGLGSMSQELSPTTSDPSQFPSIITVPTPGAWQLTLGTGRGAGHVVMIAVKGGR